MNFKHLEYAVAVARYNSIRKAAQNLFISQPYLSGTIYCVVLFNLYYGKFFEIPKTVSFLSVSNRGGFYDALHSGHYLTVSAFMHEPKDPSLCIVPIDSKKEQPSTSKVNSRSFFIQ